MTLDPRGSSVSIDHKRRAQRSEAYRLEQRRLDQFEKLARLIIKYRATLDISQAELARRVGTSVTAISRLESGRHKSSVATLQRVAHALGMRLVLGFESRSRGRATREIVSA